MEIFDAGGVRAVRGIGESVLWCDLLFLCKKKAVGCDSNGTIFKVFVIPYALNRMPNHLTGGYFVFCHNNEPAEI